MISPDVTPAYSHVALTGNYIGNSGNSITWVKPGCVVHNATDTNGNEYIEQECGLVTQLVNTVA